MVDVGAAEAARLVRELHARQPRLKVLAVSIEPPGALLQELSPKALAHLPKPFALSTLLRTVRGLLDGGSR